MITKEKIKERKLALIRDAGKSWKQSQPPLKGFEKPSTFKASIGQQERRQNFETREASRKLLQPEKMLNTFERIIGPSFDSSIFAPDELAYKSGRPVAMLHQYVEGRHPSGFATGFMVSDSLLITNYHVFATIDDAQGCAATFEYEYDSIGIKPGITFRFSPEKFFHSDEKLDFTVVCVEPLSIDGKGKVKDMGCLKLIATKGKILEGDPLTIIQHPMGRPKEYAFTENTVKEINDDEGWVRYTTDTQSASSGSPAFNRYYEVSALHHRGVPYMIDDNIYTEKGEVWDGEDEDDVHWVANEGISVSKIVATLESLKYDDDSRQQLLQGLLSNTGDPLNVLPGTLNEKLPIPLNQKNQHMTPYTFNFYGPVTINITGQSQEINPSSPRIATELALEAKIKFDEDYDSRENKGYDTNFISGYTIALPAVEAARAQEIYQEDGKELVLKYYNYSLVMNKLRRMAMWTAVNVNYHPDMKSKIHTKRDSFGSAAWRVDPRIPARYQITEKELYKPAKNFDLGHVVRREDSCWGKSEKDIEFANSDTFHLTNCTPQHEAFNQSNPSLSDKTYIGIKGIWGELENKIQQQLNKNGYQGIVFAGPVLDNTNDPVKDFGSGRIQYPTRFWKIVVVNDKTEGLSSYAFLLDQSNRIAVYGVGHEKFQFPDFAKEQVTVAEIQTLAGINFDPQVLQADVMRNNTGKGQPDKRAVNGIIEPQWAAV